MDLNIKKNKVTVYQCLDTTTIEKSCIFFKPSRAEESVLFRNNLIPFSDDILEHVQLSPALGS